MRMNSIRIPAPPGCTKATCGDGFTQAGEECDDGNASNGDACLSTCVLGTCGDGFLNPDTEQCDDGNALNPTDVPISCTRCLWGWIPWAVWRQVMMATRSIPMNAPPPHGGNVWRWHCPGG